MEFETLDMSELAQRPDAGVTRLKVPAVWEKTRGAGVTVAIVDSGISGKHPDLKGAVGASRDFTGSPGPGIDKVGHGTHVAGIVAARDNELGIVGVAPAATLLNAKIVRDSKFVPTPALVAEAILWCVECKADVICLSLEWRKAVPHVREAIATANAKGAIVVAAAGNRGETGGPVGYPAAWPEALAVGFVEWLQSGVRMSVDSAAGPEIDVLAPGSRILSTFPETIYAFASGTSMAAPFVAGAIALLIAHRRRTKKPPMTLADVERALRTTANRDVAMDPVVSNMVGLIDPTRFIES